MSILNEPVTLEEEMEFFRNCRRLGMIPNPKLLKGERREWATEMQELRSRFDELDRLVFEGGDNASD